jgi:hypothetical protein
MFKDFEGVLPPVLKARLKANHHLFLGARLRDWYFRAMMHRIWGSRRANRQSWAIHPEQQPMDADYWKAAGVELIQFPFDTYIAGLRDRIERVPAV